MGMKAIEGKETEMMEVEMEVEVEVEVEGEIVKKIGTLE